MKISLAEIEDALGKYEKKPEVLSPKAEAAAKELADFLSSELGIKAIALLRASHSHVLLYGDPDERGSHYISYVLSGQGLSRVSGHASTYSSQSENAIFQPVSPHELMQEISKKSLPQFPFGELMTIIENRFRASSAWLHSDRKAWYRCSGLSRRRKVAPATLLFIETSISSPLLVRRQSLLLYIRAFVFHYEVCLILQSSYLYEPLLFYQVILVPPLESLLLLFVTR